MAGELKKLYADVPEMTLEEMDAEDRELFTAMEELEKSGKIALRIPKTLHAELAEQAKREGVSLNQYCLYKLTH